MPQVNKTFTLNVKPHEYIAACTAAELKELDKLLTRTLKSRKRRSN